MSFTRPEGVAMVSKATEPTTRMLMGLLSLSLVGGDSLRFTLTGGRARRPSLHQVLLQILPVAPASFISHIFPGSSAAFVWSRTEFFRDRSEWRGLTPNHTCRYAFSAWPKPWPSRPGRRSRHFLPGR